MGATPVRQRRLKPPIQNHTLGAEATTARAYAQHLLESLSAWGLTAPRRPLELTEEHPALSWARSGLMALTGLPDGNPQMCPVPLAACADGALAALDALAGANSFAGLQGAGLLSERAAIAGHQRAGRSSPGGSCRLLDAADGVIALNLARPDDWDLLPAWLEADVSPDWDAVATAVRGHAKHALVQRGRELGLAIAPSEWPAASSYSLPSVVGAGGAWYRLMPTAPNPSDRVGKGSKANAGSSSARPRVVDLSSLWAGPLCSRLLRLAGAEVIKVESTQRPDGARNGPPEFFDRLNAGKHSVMLDFSTIQGLDQLRDWIAKADIVIEGSRPRGLRQLGIRAEDCVREHPRLTWIGISGYGRGEPGENWIAYGDDAAVAAGLSQLQFQATGEQMIVGDAIADPLTGLHAALLAWASWQTGGGRLLSLSLRDVVAHCVGFDCPATQTALRLRQQDWTALVAGEVHGLGLWQGA